MRDGETWGRERWDESMSVDVRRVWGTIRQSDRGQRRGERGAAWMLSGALQAMLQCCEPVDYLPEHSK